MENCFVSKFKGVVNNPYLLKLEEFGFTVPAGTTLSGRCTGKSSPSTAILSLRVGNATVNDSSFPFTLPTNYNPTPINIVAGLSDAFIVLNDRKNVIDPSIFVKGWDVSEIGKKFPSTTALYYPSEINGTLQELATSLPNIVYFLYNESADSDNDISGNIKDLAPVARSLVYLRLYKASNVNGAFEDFVAKAATKTNDPAINKSQIVIEGFKNSLITFNGQDISDGTAFQKNLSWSKSGDNTIITFGSDSTTIHINSDGTWTRVS